MMALFRWSELDDILMLDGLIVAQLMTGKRQVYRVLLTSAEFASLGRPLNQTTRERIPWDGLLAGEEPCKQMGHRTSGRVLLRGNQECESTPCGMTFHRPQEPEHWDLPYGRKARQPTSNPIADDQWAGGTGHLV